MIPDDRREPLSVGDLLLDPATGNAWWRGAPLDLHPREFRLLLALALYPDRAVPADVLADAVWGSASKAGPAYVALYIRALQQKLEAEPSRPRVLRAVRGGYRLLPRTPAAARSPLWSMMRLS